MNDPVVQLCQLGIVPAVGCPHQVAGDALQLVDMLAAALRAFFQVWGGVFVTALQTAVTVVVYRTVADVVSVHHVHYTHNDFRIVGGVTVYLHIEDVSAAGQFMIRSLHFRFVAGAAFVVYGHVVGVGVVVTVRNARQRAELLTVDAGELARQPFGRSGKHAVVVLVLLRELVGTVAHIGHDFQSQLLGFARFAVMFSEQCHETFCQPDETDSQCSLVDDGSNRIVRFQLLAAYPQGRHQ